MEHSTHSDVNEMCVSSDELKRAKYQNKNSRYLEFLFNVFQYLLVMKFPFNFFENLVGNFFVFSQELSCSVISAA